MSMMALRNAPQSRRNFYRNFLLILAAIAGLILAQFMMHSLNPGHSASASSATVNEMPWQDEPQIVHETGELAGVIGCGVVCSPNHCLASATCTLTLPAPQVLVGTAPAITVWPPLQRWTESTSARRTTLTVPDPPSLLFLSISRT